MADNNAIKQELKNRGFEIIEPKGWRQGDFCFFKPNFDYSNVTNFLKDNPDCETTWDGLFVLSRTNNIRLYIEVETEHTETIWSGGEPDRDVEKETTLEFEDYISDDEDVVTAVDNIIETLHNFIDNFEEEYFYTPLWDDVPEKGSDRDMYDYYRDMEESSPRMKFLINKLNEELRNYTIEANKKFFFDAMEEETGLNEVNGEQREVDEALGLENFPKLKKYFISSKHPDNWSLNFDSIKGNCYLQDDDTGEILVQGDGHKLINYIKNFHECATTMASLGPAPTGPVVNGMSVEGKSVKKKKPKKEEK